MRPLIGKQIRKQIRVLLWLVLSVFMLSEAVPASGAYTTGGYSGSLIIRGEGSGGEGSRILSAKKKKKKKKNNGSSQGSQNNTSSKQENNSSGNSQGKAGTRKRKARTDRKPKGPLPARKTKTGKMS